MYFMESRNPTKQQIIDKNNFVFQKPDLIDIRQNVCAVSLKIFSAVD